MQVLAEQALRLWALVGQEQKGNMKKEGGEIKLPARYKGITQS
jgi:hypothetical protein